MLKAMRGILITMAILLFAVNTMAQNAPSGRWWRSPRVVKALNLTGGEIQQLESAYGQSRREMINKKNRVEKEQLELENMMGKRKLNESAIRKQNRKLEQVRKIIGHGRFQQLVNLRP